MAYNPALYFPQNYTQTPIYQPMQQPQMAPSQGRMIDIIPVDSIQAAEAFPIPVGTTQLMIAKDDSFLAIKVNGVNGQSSFTVYDKRPPAPPEPAFDPSEYLRRDEAEKLIESILTAKKRTPAKKEEET